MIRRSALLLSFAVLIQGSPQGADRAEGIQPAVQQQPPRAIRRDVPLTNSIRRAHEAKTRDTSGRPGPNYWQLQTDYTISARLDPATQTITGEETIALHNNSPQELTEILLRLDHNIFRGLVPRGGSVPAENTEGMVVTRISVDGEAVDLAARANRRPRTGPEHPAPFDRFRSRPDPRPPHAVEAGGRQVGREARDRMADETSRRHRGPRPPHDSAVG